jgi:hypothetical protein
MQSAVRKRDLKVLFCQKRGGQHYYNIRFLLFKEPVPFKIALKYFGDCLRSHDGSTGTNLDPPLFWSCNTFYKVL